MNQTKRAMKDLRVALVYDRVNKWGGAERILLALHELFPNAPLFTSVYSSKGAKWAKNFEVKPSFLQTIPFSTSHHELFALAMPVAFESFSFDDYDLVISVTSEAAKGILTKPHTVHICYCLTPTRYLWSGYQVYFTDSASKALSYPAVTYLRSWDKSASQRPDHFVAISTEVKKRIAFYYKRDSLVVYPPMMFDEKIEVAKEKSTKPFFLVVSRLSKFTTYKRIDLAVQSCNELKLPLKIVGSGSWEKELKAMAGPTVEFVGSVTDKELAWYYTNCLALIFPTFEDFGLTVVEAQYFGKPVIAFRGGGALETVIEGKTGIFFDKQTKESLKDALKKFKPSQFKSEDCYKQAIKFSKNIFKKHFFAVVVNIMK